MGREIERLGDREICPRAQISHSPNLQSSIFNLHTLLLFLLSFLLTACAGRPGGATPTALPPDVARPVQPAPVFDNSARVFRLTPVPTIAPPAVTSTQLDSEPPSVPTLAAYALLRAWLPERPPTALGIVRGSAALLDAPDGAVIARLPSGATVTVTGRAADGRYLAVYTDVGAAGWVTASGLTLYGEDDLVVVDEPVGAGPIATMVAEAME
jgi:hypothetical protein